MFDFFDRSDNSYKREKQKLKKHITLLSQPTFYKFNP